MHRRATSTYGLAQLSRWEELCQLDQAAVEQRFVVHAQRMCAVVSWPISGIMKSQYWWVLSVSLYASYAGLSFFASVPQFSLVLVEL
jgi:hypothetical protein